MIRISGLFTRTEHFGNKDRPVTPLENISASVLDLILGILLPLLRPTIGDEQAARAVALELLAAHDPRTNKELCLTAEAIAYSLRGLTLLVQSTEPGASLEQRLAVITSACRLDNAGARAQRRLDQAQRAVRQPRRPAQPAEPAEAASHSVDDDAAAAVTPVVPQAASAPADPASMGAAPSTLR